jgi:hypothetical protein
MAGGWQQAGGYNWQQSQAKPQPSMPHSSPQNRPNYNVSFSAMPAAQGERGKGSTNLGEDGGVGPGVGSLSSSVIWAWQSFALLQGICECHGD